MVGRGPVQLMYHPNNAAPSAGSHGGVNDDSSLYSNQQTHSKMESYDIPNNIPIKQEQPFITPMAVSYEQESKYTQFLLGGGYHYPHQHLIPTQQQQQETGILFLPIEQVSNNSYKQQQQQEEPLLFQKYPSGSTDSTPNWSNDTTMYSNETGANFMLPSSTSSYLTYDKEKTLQKDDDILAQLLDEGGFSFEEFGNIYIPSNDDMLIPVQPVGDNTCYSPPQTSPMQQSYPTLDELPLMDGPSPSSGLVLMGGENSDPLVSGLNEATPSPSNEIMSLNNETHHNIPVDNLQDILGELFGEDDGFMLDNSFSHTPHESTSNIIPTTATISPDILSASFSIEDEETSNNHVPIEDDMIIPSTVDYLPATKKPRMSNSSSMSLEDIHVPKPNLSLPLNKQSKKASSPLSSSSSPPSSFKLPDSPPSSSSSHKLPTLLGGGGSMLFGQHEDEIIKKLLKPQDRNGSKPITRDKLVTMAVEEFNTLLDEASLTEIEVAFMKEWRRRGKNKMAAQIARKRKREELFELEDDMDTLRQRRVKLQQSVQSLTTLIASYKRRAETAEKRIYKHYSTTHGSLVSQETHTIHMTDDGKTMLIPRTSNQVLLV